MNDYVGVIITPDSIRDGLSDAILSDLFATIPAEVLWQASWLPTQEAIRRIYPNLQGRISSASIMRTMLLGECLVLIARGHNLYKQLKEIKGHFTFEEDRVEVTGLRHKYRNWREKDLVKLGFKSQAALDLIFEFRLHTTDSLRETAIFCLVCMSESELFQLHTLAPPLYNEINIIRSLNL